MSEREIFFGAIKLSGAARDAFVREACGGDEGLRQQVEALLQAHDQSQETWMNYLAVNYPIRLQTLGAMQIGADPVPYLCFFRNFVISKSRKTRCSHGKIY